MRILILLFRSNNIINSENKILKFFYKIIKSMAYSSKLNLIRKRALILIFSFIIIFLFANFFSVFRYIFPRRSQLGRVFFLSFSFWVGIIIFFIVKSFKGFMSHIIPEGTPIFLTSLIFLIEIVRNIIRPITVSVRLVANILAGHLLITLLSKIIFLLPSLLPLYLILNLVEIFVAIIQAYIFTTIILLYYSDVK